MNSNLNTGLAMLCSLLGLLLMWGIIAEARRTNWKRTMRAFVTWLGELIVSGAIAVVVVAILFGLTWLIGLLVNTIWSFFHG